MQHDHILKKLNLFGGGGGGGEFWLQGHNLNKLGRSSQGDATYQMPCGFRQILFMFSYFTYVSHVTPGAGPFLAPGA